MGILGAQGRGSQEHQARWFQEGPGSWEHWARGDLYWGDVHRGIPRQNGSCTHWGWSQPGTPNPASGAGWEMWQGPQGQGVGLSQTSSIPAPALLWLPHLLQAFFPLVPQALWGRGDTELSPPGDGSFGVSRSKTLWGVSRAALTMSPCFHFHSHRLRACPGSTWECRPGCASPQAGVSPSGTDLFPAQGDSEASWPTLGLEAGCHPSSLREGRAVH